MTCKCSVCIFCDNCAARCTYHKLFYRQFLDHGEVRFRQQPCGHTAEKAHTDRLLDKRTVRYQCEDFRGSLLLQKRCGKGQRSSAVYHIINQDSHLNRIS